MALINTTTTGVLGSTFYGDGAGALTVQKDGVTQGVYGNIPAFSAYNTGSQTNYSATTWTKIALQGESFDTNSVFDNASNYRFTPNVAGYYLMSAWVGGAAQASPNTVCHLALYKNGSVYKGSVGGGYAGYYQHVSFTDIVYMNGTTDYLELYIYASAASYYTGSTFGQTLAGTTGMAGVLIKAV